uniref:Uncharacterized protein n=1 Tax=Macaca mulatta TaxID=9544 RepID=A0A5F7ZEC7_MACMU
MCSLGFSVLPRLDANSTSWVHCKICLLGSSDSPTSASQAAGTIGAHHLTQLIFVFLVEMGFHHVIQAGLKLLTSSDLPASASQSAGITGMTTMPGLIFVFLVQRGFHHVGQAGLKLLTSSDLPASTSQSVKISQLQWHVPVVPVTGEAEVGGLLEPRSLRLQ